MNLALVITDGGGGWLTGEILLLPGCISQGRTIEELRANIREAAEGWLECERDQTLAEAAREPGTKAEIVEH